MANRRTEPVSYRPLRIEPNFQEGLLAVERDGGDLERKVAFGLARVAQEQGLIADRQREAQGIRDSKRDAAANAPTGATVEGGETIGAVSGKASASSGTRVVLPPANIQAILNEAANRHGVSAHALSETARLESGFNPNAKNPNSSAGGLLQFIDSTASDYGLQNKFDPAASADAGARLMRDNATALRGALGREPTAGELYLAHQQGSGGAIKLLANPFAKAADLVGADAVRLNGGSADMSATDFANLWISKVNGGGEPQTRGVSQLPSPSSVAPVSVTPLTTPVKITPGKAGTWRPTGEDTIYGRAYDTQGERTYLEMADAAMVENQLAIYEAYKDNPAMLQKALDEGLTADLQDNVFEEIAPEYTIAYRKRAASLLSQARTESEKRAKEANRIATLDRVAELQTQQARLLAGFDPNNPLAGSQLADTQASIDALYDGAAARGIIDAADAAAYKARSRSDMTIGFYAAQSRDLPADQIEAMRSEMHQHFIDGTLEGVTADDWDEIDKRLVAAAGARRTQDEVATKSLQQRGDELVNKKARGIPVTADELARFQLDIRTATNGREIASSMYARMRVAEALRRQPIGTVERDLEKILKGNGDTIDPADTEFARKTIAEFRQAVLTDPLGKAEAIGLIPPVAAIPVDGTATPEDIASAVAYRRGAAEGVARHFGIQPRYFRPGEADAVMKAAEENPEALVVFTQSVRDAFGKDAAKALSEFSESGPALAHAAGLSIATGDVGIARDVATTLQLKRRKELPDLTPDTIRKASALGASSTAGAFLADPRTQNATLQTAQLLFEQDAARLGIDPSEVKTPGSTAETTYLKALDRALGGRVVNGEAWGGIDEVNGFKIVTPSDMPKGRPQELLEDISDEQLKALPAIASNSGFPITASDLRGANLVSVGDGIYRVALGDPAGDEPRYLTNSRGTYWTLDIRALAALPKTDRRGGFNPFGWQGAQP